MNKRAGRFAFFCEISYYLVMAKKRKTRKEKELLQERRAAGGRKKQHSSSSLAPDNHASMSGALARGGSAVEQNEEQHLRMKSMKYSLIVFGGLVVFQIAVWLSARIDFLPSGWVDILVS